MARSKTIATAVNSSRMVRPIPEQTDTILEPFITMTSVQYKFAFCVAR